MAKTNTDWTLLKDTDPEKYAAIKKKQLENRKAVMDKKYADPVWHAKWVKSMVEGRKRKAEQKQIKKLDEIRQELEKWQDVEDWVKEIEKTLTNRLEALKKIRPFIAVWYKLWKAGRAKTIYKEQQSKFRQENPNYTKEWFAKHGGAAEVKRKQKAKKANKEAAEKHLETAEMTAHERKRFKYDNMLDTKQERVNFRNWLKKNDEPLERTPFLDPDYEHEPPKKRGPKPKSVDGHSHAFKKWEVILTKPERQMTLEEIGQAAGGPINWVPDSHQRVDIPTSEWDD